MGYSISITQDLRKNPYKGIYIALEGIDGSGKTTQTQALKKHFESIGKKVVLAKSARRDKGLLADINKKILEGNLDIPKPAFQYLFSADYIIQTEQIIIPALQRGDIVITDRFHCWSSVAYGIWENSKGKDYDVSLARFILFAHGLFSKTYQLIVPDITFYFDISINTGMNRMSRKKAGEVHEKKDILEKVTIGYKWLIKEFPKEFEVINGEQSEKKVTSDILKIISKDRKFKVL